MPQLILICFLGFAVWLIRRDVIARPGISTAIWIPTLWVGILASKPISAWTGFGTGGSTLDGSPLDRLFYLTMILAAIVVLSRRGVNWGWVIPNNWPIVLFYTFLLLSVLWANSPFVSFKRWFKESGNILVALVILTEAAPLQAIRAVFVRCAYVLIPLSIIYIRYFPYIGRRYNVHSGELEAIGVTFQKNSLGTMVLVCGIIFLWDSIERSRSAEMVASTIDRYLTLAMGAIAGWLMHLCDSKTSMVALVVGGGIIVATRFPALHRRVSAFGFFFLVAVIVFFLVDQTLGITEAVVTALGRDMTFTGRTQVWHELLNVGTDPLLGTGFMSFWDDDGFQSKLPYWVSSSAHNGYLEVYLAGGIIGVSILAVMLLGTGARINRDLASGSHYSIVRFAIFVAVLIANFAESNFASMTPLGFLFLLSAIGTARPPMHRPTTTPDTDTTYAADQARDASSQSSLSRPLEA